MSNDNQQRLILNCYNQGVEKLIPYIDKEGFEKGIEVNKYNKDTLDEYRRWKERNGFMDNEDEK